MKELLRSTQVYKEISQKGSMAHAALIIFPDPVYGRLMLKECAKAFFFAEEGGRTARLIDGESFLDCKILPPEGGKFTAEIASALPAESMLRPVEGKNKLYCVDGFGSVPPLVQNKLLKLLEEPPEGVSFLLCAVNEHGILPTVLSRVTKYAVPRFSPVQIERALVRAYGQREGVREAALSCGGVYSAAETLLSEGGDLRLAEEFLRGGKTVEICREIGDKKRASFFPALRLILRDMLLYKTGGGEYATFPNGRYKELAALYPAGAILSALDGVDGAERDMRFNANAGQAAFDLALAIREERIKWKRLS